MILRTLLVLCAVSLVAQTPKPASVSGRAVSNTGQPLKKSTITLRSVDAAPTAQGIVAPYSTLTDAEGKFIFEAVDPGRYMLSADRPGFQRQNYGAKNSGSGGTILTLTPSQTMEALELVLSPQIAISGKVLDSDGDPIGHIQIRVMRMLFMNGKRRLTTFNFSNTDESGEYTVKGLGPGKYYLSASPSANGFFGEAPRSAAIVPVDGKPPKQDEAMVQTYYPSVTDVSSAQMVELTPGHDRPGTDITLRKVPVYHLRGKVSGTISNDRSPARVMVTSRSSDLFGFSGDMSSAVAKDGTFDIANVPAGAYALILTSLSGMIKVMGSLPVDVANRNLDGLALVTEPLMDLTGQLTVAKDPVAAPPGKENDGANDPPKASAPPSRISLQPVDGPFMGGTSGTVSENGSFTLAGISPSKYRVYVNFLPPGAYVESIRYGEQDVLANNLNLPPGGSSTPLEIVLSPHAASVSGTVQSADGKPMSSAIVTLIPDPPAPAHNDLYKQTNSDQNGAFTITAVGPGKYRVYAWDELENGSQFDPDFLKLYESKGVKLDLAKSGSGQATLTVISTSPLQPQP